MSFVALNSVTQTLEMDDNRWDIWAVRGTVNPANDDIPDFSFNHIYGISNTVLYSSVNEAAVKTEILAELQKDHTSGATNAADLRFVGTYILHDVESIIGLDAFPALAEFSSVRALNVMRVTGIDLDTTSGCDAFPIAVNNDIRSATKPLSELLPGEDSPNPYPEASHFTYPGGPPHDPDPPPYGKFTNHVPNIPLPAAKEGTIYKIREGAPGVGNFAWLVWNNLYVTANANTLADSLEWPGNGSNYPTYGYYEPGDPTDMEMNIGDWVASSTGAISANAVQTQMEDHVIEGLTGRTLRLIVWDTTNGQTGVNLWYQIKRFAIFKFHGYRSNSGQGGPWIIAEFIRFDDSCGQTSP
jgi:hypothetical protein